MRLNLVSITVTYHQNQPSNMKVKSQKKLRFTSVGLFYDYYFETANEMDKLFKANYSIAISSVIT